MEYYNDKMQLSINIRPNPKILIQNQSLMENRETIKHGCQIAIK